MHLRQYVIVHAGLFTMLFCAFALFTPLVSTGYPYWDRSDQRCCGVTIDPRGGSILPTSAASELKSKASAWDQDWFRVVGAWTPTPDQIAALEKELPVRFEALRSYDEDSTIKTIATASRQYLGLNDFLEGGYILVIGYDATIPHADPFAPIHERADSAWRWSAHYDPRSGRFTALWTYRWD